MVLGQLVILWLRFLQKPFCKFRETTRNNIITVVPCPHGGVHLNYQLSTIWLAVYVRRKLLVYLSNTTRMRCFNCY